MWNLKGKTALVTGGGSGIGKAISRAFIDQGANVIFFGTNKEKGERAKKEFEEASKSGAKAYFFQVDVSKKAEVEEAVKEAFELAGSIEILVNNAGITKDQLLLRMPEEDWDLVMDINMKSCYNLCQALIRSMMKSRYGKIINISSVVGVSGNPGQTNYAASKAAMIGFTKSLAKELASRNIMANCVAPGYIETEMTQSLPEEKRKSVMDDIPLNRMGKPEDIANMVLFLASDLSNYITGQVFIVDGGMTL